VYPHVYCACTDVCVDVSCHTHDPPPPLLNHTHYLSPIQFNSIHKLQMPAHIELLGDDPETWHTTPQSATNTCTALIIPNTIPDVETCTDIVLRNTASVALVPFTSNHASRTANRLLSQARVVPNRENNRFIDTSLLTQPPTWQSRCAPRGNFYSNLVGLNPLQACCKECHR
jgi:hypothetical protein